MNLCNLESLSAFLSIGKWLLEIMLSQGTLYIFHNNYYFSRFYTRITINFLIISVNTEFVH